MHFWTRLVRDHRRLAALLVALALCAKALVPAGFMVESQGRVFTVAICADASGGQLTRQITIPHREGSGGNSSHQDSSHQDRATATCAWTGLSGAADSLADPLLVVLALVFLLALGFLPQRELPQAQSYRLRPPLRGPPLTA